MCEKGRCLLTLWKKVKTASGINGNRIEVSIIRKNQFRVLRSLKLGGNG